MSTVPSDVAGAQLVTQSLDSCLTVDGRRFERFHMIQHSDPHAGFSSLITNVLNGIRKALEHNWLPVVNYDKRINDYFYDPEFGPNIWEYYFEPVMGVSYSTVKELLEKNYYTVL